MLVYEGGLGLETTRSLFYSPQLLIYQNSHSLEILPIHRNTGAPGSTDYRGMAWLAQLFFRKERRFEWVYSQSLLKVTP